jgi:hypothetical protein
MELARRTRSQTLEAGTITTIIMGKSHHVKDVSRAVRNPRCITNTSRLSVRGTMKITRRSTVHPSAKSMLMAWRMLILLLYPSVRGRVVKRNRKRRRASAVRNAAAVREALPLPAAAVQTQVLRPVPTLKTPEVLGLIPLQIQVRVVSRVVPRSVNVNAKERNM